MEELIENKIEKSGLITIDLQDFQPKGKSVLLDITPYLWNGFVLKEKEFRQSMKEMDWTTYQGLNVAVYNTSDAIVPSWAYMLVASYLQEQTNNYIFGSIETLETYLWINAIQNKITPQEYKDKRVLVKGCGEIEIPNAAYLEVFKLLKPYCKSIMYGEACSSVPVFKK